MSENSVSNHRMRLIRSGYKQHVAVANLRVSVSIETVWTLAVVTIPLETVIPADYLQNPNLTPAEKGQIYSLQTILNYTHQINKNRVDWLKELRGVNS